MITNMKYLTFAAVAALGLTLSACGSSNANPTPAATPDAADLTAAAIDSAAPSAPVEVPSAAASESGKPEK